MELAHRFNVPTPVEETWAHFNDIAALAECFPGAQVTEADEDSFTGSVKVKLGPIALVYNGSGTFVEKDETAHKFVVDAKGKDKRGNGTAGAKITASMVTGADNSTDVEVLTDLAITGKPAQFGRGVMQDVSDKLLGQFVNCLETRLAGPAPAAPGAAAAAAPATDPAAADASPPAGEASRHQSQAEESPTAAEESPTAAQPAAPAPAPPQDDALDLGAAVIPILAKTYWKPIAGLAVVVILLIWWATK